MARLGVFCLALMVLLAGCAGRGPTPYDGTDPNAAAVAPLRYYAPPGPPSDPWGPYIREAASRYAVPEQWVRAVMHQESGGRQQAVSPVGAMGLMQLMPATYAELQAEQSLGSDPYKPRDNILAGTAYIRRMYDKYGSPAFLAAYNAGPQRLDSYLAGGGDLPDETQAYLAAIAPRLGGAVPMSGPLAVYASAQPDVSAEAPPTVRSLASGCDDNAAFDPEHPCAPLEQAATAPAHPVAATPVGLVRAGTYAVQVGAFAREDLARAMAESARAQAPDQLDGATVALPPTTPFGGAVLYRARLVGLTADAATVACLRLNRRQLPCVLVRPGSW